jgi:hypothetical protein
VAQSRRDRIREDDLLKGFDPTGPSHGRLGGFFAITIGGSIYAWNVAFSYGAYHTFFYYRRQELFVLSLVVLLGGLIMRPRLRIRPWLFAPFTPPLLLTLLRLAFPVNHSGRVVHVFDNLLVIATLCVLPLIIWVLSRLLAPTFFTLPDRRARFGVLAIIVVVALVGYAEGRFNSHFVTCEDFQVAGDDEPKNCVHNQHR